MLNNKVTYVLSKDSDWKEYCSDNISENTMLYLADGVSPFLDAINRDVEPLQLLTESADEKFEQQKSIIEDKISEALNCAGYILDNHENLENLDLTKLTIDSINLADYEIISVENDKYIYSISCSVNAVIDYSGEDYSSATYDQEDGKYFNVESCNVIDHEIEFEYSCIVELHLDEKSGVFKIEKIEMPSDVDVLRV